MSELPKGWAAAQIGELADYVSRGRSPKYVEKSPLPVINQRCVRWHGVDEAFVKFIDPATWHQWDDVRYVRRNDILWNSTGTGTIGRAALFTELSSYEQAVVDSHVTIVRAGPGVDPAYLFGFIKSPAVQDKIEDMQSGSTNQVELNRSEILSTAVPIAPLAEQRRIVAKVDRLIARTARARKELDRIPTLVARYKQRLLALAFSGNLTAGWRLENGLPEPELAKLASLCLTLTDGDHQAPPRSDAGIPFITISAMNTGRIDLTKATRTVPQSYYDGLKPSRRPAVGDVLFSVTGSVGIPALVETKSPFVFQRHIAIIKPHTELTSGRYLYYLLAAPQIRDQVESVATGTAQLTVPLGGLRAFDVPCPTLEEQAVVVRRLDSAFGWLERMGADHAAAAHLVAKLDAAILTKAFRGELLPQDPCDEPASALLERIKVEREAEGKKPKTGRGRKPNKSKEQLMADKPLPARDRLLSDSANWPVVGLPFEEIAMRNAMAHDALRDALFELLSGPSPALQQRFDADAEVMVIQRVAA